MLSPVILEQEEEAEIFPSLKFPPFGPSRFEVPLPLAPAEEAFPVGGPTAIPPTTSLASCAFKNSLSITACKLPFLFRCDGLPVAFFGSPAATLLFEGKLVPRLVTVTSSNCFSFTLEDLIFGLPPEPPEAGLELDPELFLDESLSLCSLGTSTLLPPAFPPALLPPEDLVFASEDLELFGEPEADFKVLMQGLPELPEGCFGEFVPCLGLCFGLEQYAGECFGLGWTEETGFSRS